MPAHTRITQLFLDKIPQKNETWEKRCNRWGFYYYATVKNLSTIWMPEIGNPQQENMGKILKGISLSQQAISGMTCLKKIGCPNPNRALLHCLPPLWLKIAFDEVVLPSTVEEIVSSTFWNLCPTFGTENDFSHQQIDLPCCYFLTLLLLPLWIWKSFCFCLPTRPCHLQKATGRSTFDVEGVKFSSLLQQLEIILLTD